MYLLMGWISGSTHVSCSDLVDNQGIMKGPTEVKQILEDKGVDLKKEVYISCGWGITVCVLENAMLDIEGVKTKVYDGSYAEY